ncbi:hypothetical protein MPSEU_000017900 [Mayamaea pseudoterrestris]|nr:hypothetical protein MPSEU_000017900 [Mayamaea pseudoterrestris]
MTKDSICFDKNFDLPCRCLSWSDFQLSVMQRRWILVVQKEAKEECQSRRSSDERPFSHVVTTTPPANLTREEVCCLKTALAMVIIKRRVEARRAKAAMDERESELNANEHGANETIEQAITKRSELSLCPWLPSGEQSSSAQAKPACTPQHLDAMFQLAVNAILEDRDSTPIGTHIRAQLLAHADDILLQQWLRNQVNSLPNGQEAAAQVWAVMLRPAAAVELAVRVLEELTPVIQSVLDDATATNARVSFHSSVTANELTFCLLRVMDACLTNLLQARRIHVMQSCVQSLASHTLPLKLSQAYVSSGSSLPVVWLRIGVQQLLLQVMEHVGNGHDEFDNVMMT